MHNREHERSQLKRKLESGLSIHMPAPRRIGKTWTINRLATDLRDDDWLAIEVDVEGMRTPEKFAQVLCKRIEAHSSIKDRFRFHALQRLNNLLGGEWGDKPLDAIGKIDPIEFAETLIESLDETVDKAAIIVDEVSYFFLALAEDDPDEARDFAYRLRAFQQRYKNVRWLITGSIGLDTVARRHGLQGAFVDFETFILETFTSDEARSYMRDPVIQQQFNHVFDATDDAYESAFERLGWLAPYYLKMIANEVRPSGEGENGKPPQATEEDLMAAFDKLLQPNRRAEFAIWREHIEKNLPDADGEIALKILNVLCQVSEGEADDTLLANLVQWRASVTKRETRDILEMLVNDGMIELQSGRYVFRSGLVRQYWQRYEAD